MARVRLTSLALAGSLVFFTGCSTCWDFSLFNRCRGTQAHDCCEDVAMSAPACSAGVCNGGPALPGGHPAIVEGPVFPPSPTPLPGAAVMPPGAVPRPNPLPPVVTIPQATPIPSPP
jgi:hypothetical protein